jgi:RND family efflux transporter MFP subunit
VVARLDAETLELAEREARSALARIASQLDYQERQLGRLATLKRRSSVAENLIDESRNQRDLLRHDRERAEVALAESRRQVREATVRAPFAGVVAERRAQRGEFLAPGAVMVRLVDTAHIEVSARAPVVLRNGLQAGDAVALRAGTEDEVRATVRAVVPGGDAQSHQLELRIVLQPDAWPIGTALQVGVPAGSAQAAVAVPRDALVLRGAETFVFRIGPDRKAERVAVETGRSSGDLVEVRGGIAVGDTLVVRGAERLEPGQAVAIRSRS